MTSESAPMPPALVGELFGITDQGERAFLDALLPALERISPSLVPPLLHHPLALEIAEGVSAYPSLLARLKDAGNPGEKVAILDAIAEIAARAHATHDVVVVLEQLLGAAEESSVVTMAARALACCRHQGFLAEQRKVVASGDPLASRIAAKLLGYGKDAEAVPALLSALRPENASGAEEIIWALGEIGDVRAAAPLHGLLARSLFVEASLTALGKIGAAVSLPRILTYLAGGTASQRERSAEAIGLIYARHGAGSADAALDKDVRAVLLKTAESDDSSLARYQALVAFARAGGTLEAKRILRALGATLEPSQLSAVQTFLVAGRGKPRTGVRRPKPDR